MLLWKRTRRDTIFYRSTSNSEENKIAGNQIKPSNTTTRFIPFVYSDGLNATSIS